MRPLARPLFVSVLLTWTLGIQAADSTKVSMSLRDVSIEEALAMLAKQQRLNILLSGDVQGQLSLNLYDVPVERAVHSIANAAGYAVERRDGAYFVMGHDEVGLYSNGDLTRVQKFNINYADPDALEGMLEPYLSGYGKIKAMPERKLLLVSDKPEFLRRIALIVRHADAKPRQVIIEAQILEISLTNEDSFGIDWARFYDSDNTTGGYGTQGLSGGGSSGSSGFFFDYVNPDVGVILRALQQDGRVRTLSTPKLIALDNQEAEVVIGDRRGYTVTTTINQVTSESIEFLESGVILRVTPHIDEEGRILMDVHPEVSNGSVDAAGVPSQTTTEVTTSLLVPSGETVFIGGLMKHTVSQGYKRVPVLGRIPGIKRLFSSRERTQADSETIVLITPRVVEDLAGDWNADPVEKVEEAQQSLESDADDLLEILEAETAQEHLGLPVFSRSTSDAEAMTAVAPNVAPDEVTPDESEGANESAGESERASATPAASSSPQAVRAEVPTQDAPIGELPADFYAVQLMTMSSQDGLNAYVAEHDLADLPTVRIERDGELYYALLLGVYESYNLALAALAGLPPSFDDKRPWIRPVRSLQTAMRRAGASEDARNPIPEDARNPVPEDDRDPVPEGVGSELAAVR